MNKYTGKINGHPVEFEWDGKVPYITAKTDGGTLHSIPKDWITDIKPVEPEQPNVDWSKLEKKPDCEVRDNDDESWTPAVYLSCIDGDPYKHKVALVKTRQTGWKQCKLLTPPQPVSEKEEVEFTHDFKNEFTGDTYHIRKVKGKDATITKVEG